MAFDKKLTSDDSGSEPVVTPPVEEVEAEPSVMATNNLGSAFHNEEGEPYELVKSAYGLILRKPIVDEMRKSYLDYAMSVIVSRALPDVRDGLKPVHRRILFAMHEMGIRHNTAYKKSARIVGEVLGKYHPHGDSSVYDALVRLAQDFSMRYPLVDGQGNFGSVDGDSPAAMRYTEARLAKITEELLADLDKNTVDTVDNFDGSLQEPSVLPARLPNLLLMGAEGIAVGMATKIPPHNLREVSAAIIDAIDQGSADTLPVEPGTESAVKLDPVDIAPAVLAGSFTTNATVEDILKHIHGPDFPTGGYIYDWKTIQEAYATGRGRVLMRAKAEIVEKGKGFQISITELPYQVNKAKLIVKIADLVRNKKIIGISNLRDESDREGMSVVIELKRDARPQAVLNNLFKYTELQSNFPMNMVALTADGTPQLMNIRKVLVEYIKHRQLVTVRRFQHELRGLRDRAHILEGLLIALANLDEVIKTIRASADSDIAKERLMTRFKLSEKQAVAILDMQLRKLAALERQKIEDEYQAIQKRINEILDILTHPTKILGVIRAEITDLTAMYGDERRTKLVKGKVGEINEEDLVPNEPNIITYTSGGYIKRMKPDQYRTQHRGGKGVVGMSTKEDDPVREILSAMTHDMLLLFTNTGRVFSTKVYELPESQRQAKGSALVNIINLEANESIQTIMTIPAAKTTKEKGYIVFATRDGKVKKTDIDDFRNIRSTGIIAITLKGDDRVVFTKLTTGTDDLLLVTHSGKCIRFIEDEVKVSARDTQGVQGIKLAGGDFVVGGQAFPPHPEPPADKRRKFFQQLLLITERGLGKRTNLDEYPVQKRSGQGVKVSELAAKTGKVSAALIVTPENEDVILTTKEAQAIKLPIKNIPVLKRPTQGVILMRMPENDLIVAAAVTKREDEEEAE
jgi:DNA gyrase subunit A